MKKLLVLAAVAMLAGCVSPTIPDNIPPAPPAPKGEPIRAPSTEAEVAPANDGFGGGDGFGGETPTIEVQAPAEEEESKDSDEKDDEEKPAAKEGDEAEDEEASPEAATPKSAEAGK